MTRALPDNLQLAFGAHENPDEGMCLLEAVAYVAGEPHTDRPECASPVIAAFGRSWNDSLDTDQRQRLVPYINRLVGSRGTEAEETTRSWMALDWLVRTHLPAWLRLAGLHEDADALAGLNEITDGQALDAATPTISAAGDAARAAARDAAGAAAGDAARDAAWAAAWAARAAAGAAAGDAARAAAWAAAWAARAAAGDALAPTRDELIESAHDLLDRMLQVTGN